MTADSSTATITHSGGDGGSSGVGSHTGRRSLPSPRALAAVSPSPGVSERNPIVSDPATVVETPAVVETQPEGSDGGGTCNAGGVKKSAWNRPSANGVVETIRAPVMGAASWPALIDATRPGVKSVSASSESSSKPTSDGSAAVSEAPVTSQPPPPPKQTKTNTNSHTNPNPNHGRQRPMRRGGASTGYSRPLQTPPLPPPSPPQFPVFNIYGNMVTTVLEPPMREQQPPPPPPQQRPPFKGNNWSPRSVGGAGSHDQSMNRNPARRNNNYVPRPVNNGYGGRRDHHGPRSPAARDFHIPHQTGPPPPPPFVPGYFRPTFIPHPPLRPAYVPPAIGYDMGGSYVYAPSLPAEPYRGGAPLPSHGASGSMFMPPVNPPPPLHDLILKQIEYYFSDDNLVKDDYLRLRMDEEGWVPVSLLAGFPRIKNLTTDVQMVSNSLRDSTTVEIQGDKVRRRGDWRRWIVSANRVTNQADTVSQSTADNSVEEASVQKLTLEDMPPNSSSSSSSDNDAGPSGSSKLPNGEVGSEDLHS